MGLPAPGSVHGVARLLPSLGSQCPICLMPPLPTPLPGYPPGWRPTGLSPWGGWRHSNPSIHTCPLPLPPSTRPRDPVAQCALRPCSPHLLSVPVPPPFSSPALSASSSPSDSLQNILEQLQNPHIGLASDPPSKEPLLEIAYSLIPTRREAWGDLFGWTHWLWPPEGCPRERRMDQTTPACSRPPSPVCGTAFTGRTTSKGETEVQMGISGRTPTLLFI